MGKNMLRNPNFSFFSNIITFNLQLFSYVVTIRYTCKIRQLLRSLHGYLTRVRKIVACVVYQLLSFHL